LLHPVADNKGEVEFARVFELRLCLLAQTEQLVFLGVATRESRAPCRIWAAGLGRRSGSGMSQRENQDDKNGPRRDAESNMHSAAEGGENDIDGASIDDGVALDPKIQAQLGRVFRAYCDDLIHQPIPDKFAVLLAKLEAKQREKK
jgi:hypothetical protein